MSDGMDNKLKNLTYEEAYTAYTYYEKNEEKGFLPLLLLQGQNNVSEVKKQERWERDHSYDDSQI